MCRFCRSAGRTFAKHSRNYDHAHRCPFCLHGNLASYRHTSTSFDLQSAKVQQSHMLATRKCSDSVLTAACDVNNSKFETNKPLLVLAVSAICRVLRSLPACIRLPSGTVGNHKTREGDAKINVYGAAMT